MLIIFVIVFLGKVGDSPLAGSGGYADSRSPDFYFGKISADFQ